MTTAQKVPLASPSRRVYWDRTATVLAWWLGALLLTTLWLHSHINLGVGALLISVFLPYVLAFAWVIALVFSAQDRRVRVPVLFAPLVIVGLWLAPYTDLPSAARLALSRPLMDSYVASLPTPAVAPDRQLEDAELSDYYNREFPTACPLVLGSYLIRECKVMPGGYAFLDSYRDGEGSGLAYLPDGPPAFNVGGVEEFRKPILEPIGGPWYRLILNW